jgi:hypothetical protein
MCSPMRLTRPLRGMGCGGAVVCGEREQRGSGASVCTRVQKRSSALAAAFQRALTWCYRYVFWIGSISLSKRVCYRLNELRGHFRALPEDCAAYSCADRRDDMFSG